MLRRLAYSRRPREPRSRSCAMRVAGDLFLGSQHPSRPQCQVGLTAPGERLVRAACASRPPDEARFSRDFGFGVNRLSDGTTECATNTPLKYHGYGVFKHCGRAGCFAAGDERTLANLIDLAGAHTRN